MVPPSRRSLLISFLAGFLVLQVAGDFSWAREAADESPDPLEIELRLEGALASNEKKVRPWVLEPRVRFILDGGRARFPVIELRRGWSVPSWKGVVDSIDVKLDSDHLSGSLLVRVDSAIGVRGTTRLEFTASLTSGEIRGTFTATDEDGRKREGKLRGWSRPARASDLVLDPDESIWTLQLVRGLKDGKTLAVYLDRRSGRFTTGGALAPNYSRRPFEVDASELRREESRLVGALRLARRRSRELSDDEKLDFGTYELDARIEGSGIRGTYRGTTREGEAVEGVLRGELRPRPRLGENPRFWLKLEDGFAGGAMWQNRVFFQIATGDPSGVTGKASNNKGVFRATLDGARLDLESRPGHLLGEIRATVHESGSVSTGSYRFELDGLCLGRVLLGTFVTHHEGRATHRGYFVGRIERESGPPRGTAAREAR